MNAQKLFELYQQMYFYELEAREKITSRLQLPLAILLAALSFFGLMIQGLDVATLARENVTFLTLLVVSFSAVAVAAGFFVRALWGHTYDFIPTPDVTEGYKEELISTYKEFDDCDDLVAKYLKEYIYRYYSECASKNTHVNDTRSEALHKCNSCLVLAAIPLLATYLLFNLYNIDELHKKAPTEVVISQPIDVKFNVQLTPEGAENDRKNPTNSPTTPTN